MLLLILLNLSTWVVWGRLDAFFALRAPPLVQQDVSEALTAVATRRKHLDVDSTLRIWHTKTCSLGENEYPGMWMPLLRVWQTKTSGLG